jgi:hypothetical protein
LSPPAPVRAPESPRVVLTRCRRVLFQPRALAVLALGVFLAAAAPRLVRLLPDLKQHDRFRLAASQIEITPPPRWVPAELAAQALERAELPASMSLLDERLVATLHAAFSRHPWVERVVQVRKTPASRVIVDLEYRRPAAVLRVPGGLYAVDRDGTLLPPEDFSAADTRRLPEITGISSVPQGPAGSHWGDMSVVAAARLADALLTADERGLTFWEKWNLATIVVPPRTTAEIEPDVLAFELRTGGGSRILWGRPPGSRHPGELTVEQKIGRLEKYLADFGSFDRPHGPYEIDIRHWREISRRPLVVSQRP